MGPVHLASKRRVIIVSDASQEAWWRRSILIRIDLALTPTADFPTALRLLASEPYDLLVVEEERGETLQAFLNSVRQLNKPPSFHVILLSHSMGTGQLKPPVSRVLPSPCKLEAFNLCVAEILGIQSRKSQRHMVRLQIAMDAKKGAMSGMAATLDLSVDGMRIETDNPLGVGERLIWTFGGPAELAGLLVPGTILRETNLPTAGGLHYYAVRFDYASPQDRQVLERYLSQQF